jgi:hypothetical protein
VVRSLTDELCNQRKQQQNDKQKGTSKRTNEKKERKELNNYLFAEYSDTGGD